ncbi:unnamed protein product, partial [Linum tenue]
NKIYDDAVVSTFDASVITRKKGWRISICGSISFFLGAVINAAAVNILMLIIGRVLLGGFGFSNQAVPLYLSEMAPAKIRGAVNQLFQLTTCLGILIANLQPPEENRAPMAALQYESSFLDFQEVESWFSVSSRGEHGAGQRRSLRQHSRVGRNRCAGQEPSCSCSLPLFSSPFRSLRRLQKKSPPSLPRLFRQQRRRRILSTR